MSAVELQGVAKAYGLQAVLEGVDLVCQAGSRTAILGPSGEGKTTLLRLIAGLELPDAGEVQLAGRQVSGPGWADPPGARDLAIAFQAPALWPHMRVRDNITFGMRGFGKAEARARAEEWLVRMQLEGLGGRYPDQLSGGQAQRVSLARALAAGRGILLLDEPLSHLDVALRAELLGQLGPWLDELGATVILVTHEARDAEGLGARLLRMREGRVEVVASAGEDDTLGRER